MEKRPIKFRAWVPSERRMIYRPALLECSILEYDWASVCIGYVAGTDPDSYERKSVQCSNTLSEIGYGLVNLMQYTGLKDKNGREIYEGDIVNLGEKNIALVEWADGGFMLSLPYAAFKIHGGGEVIGNVHEHGDLLDGTHR